MSNFNKNVFKLILGTLLAQAIPIAISPVLTRLYTPDEFGVLRNTNNLNTNFNLSVNGTIFNGFRNLNSYKQAQLGIRSGELDLKRV